MQFLQTFAGLFANFGNLTWQMVVMWVIGGLLIYLAIAKRWSRVSCCLWASARSLSICRCPGPSRRGLPSAPSALLTPVCLMSCSAAAFIGIGAMIDFGPLLESRGSCCSVRRRSSAFCHTRAGGLFFDLPAASIAVIGAADGPTAIFVANTLGSKYLGAIMVAAYSYMALIAHRAAAGHPPVHDQKSG